MMRKPAAPDKKQNNLSRRLLIYVILCSSILTLLATSIQLYIEFKKDYNSVESSLEFIKTSYVPAITLSAYNYDLVQARLQLKGVLNLYGVKFLKLTIRMGKSEIVISEGNPDIVNTKTKKFFLKYKEQGQKIFNAGELTAIISYTDIFDRLIDRITIVFITNAVKTFCAVFIIFFIFQFVITRHLKEMAMWARNLNFDKLDSRFSLDRQKPNVPDELEEVVIALNDMRKRILLELAANKKAEMALKESEEKFRSIFENSPIATVHLNNLGITTACNDNFCDIMGGPKEKIIGLDTIQFVKDERMLASILKALSGRKSQYEGKYLSVTGGILTPVNAKFAPVLSVKDQVIGVIGILEDISERLAAEQNNIKLEDQLRQTQKMEAVSMLAGGIAHDFNNMLGVITGNVSYSLSIIDKDNEVYEVLTDILEGAAQAQKLTQQLLTFSTGGGSG